MAATKKLYRYPKEGKLSGVCAGLAHYLDQDVTVVRVVFVLLAFISGGSGLLAYIILAIVVPAVPTSVPKKLAKKSK